MLGVYRFDQESYRFCKEREVKNIQMFVQNIKPSGMLAYGTTYGKQDSVGWRGVFESIAWYGAAPPFLTPTTQHPLSDWGQEEWL